jgi:hypothetical protein
LEKPFLNLLKMELSFEWKEEQKMAFEDLKDKLSFALILRFLEPFGVHTDANNFTISGVLMQDGHLIAFESKKLVGFNYNG